MSPGAETMLTTSEWSVGGDTTHHPTRDHLNQEAFNIFGFFPTVNATKCPSLWCEHRLHQVVSLYILPVFSISGILLNILFLVVMFRGDFTRLYDIVKTYMIAIGVTNLLACATILASGFTRCLSHPADLFKKQLVATIITPLATLLGNINTFLTLVLAAERIAFMRKVLENPNYAPPLKSSCMEKYGSIALLCVALFLANTPHFVSFVYHKGVCYLSPVGERFFYKRIYPWLRIVFVCFGPLVVIVILNLVLIHYLRRITALHFTSGASAVHRMSPSSPRLGRGNNDTTMRRSPVKVERSESCESWRFDNAQKGYIHLLVCKSLIHFCCNLMQPFLQLHWVQMVTGMDKPQSSVVYKTLVACSQVLVNISYAADFILFYTFSKQFRVVSKHVLLSRPRAIKRRTNSNRIKDSPGLNAEDTR